MEQQPGEDVLSAEELRRRRLARLGGGGVQSNGQQEQQPQQSMEAEESLTTNPDVPLSNATTTAQKQQEAQKHPIEEEMEMSPVKVFHNSAEARQQEVQPSEHQEETQPTPPSTREEGKGSWPDLESTTQLNKRLNDSPPNQVQSTLVQSLVDMATDVSGKGSLGSSLTGKSSFPPDVSMDWDPSIDDSTERRDTKRQKGPPVVEEERDPVTDVILPLLSRIFVLDEDVLPAISSLDTKNPYYYMDAVSVLLTKRLCDWSYLAREALTSSMTPILEVIEKQKTRESWDSSSKFSLFDELKSSRDIQGLILFYLMQSYEVIDQETREVVKIRSHPMVSISDVLMDARCQCVQFSTVILTKGLIYNSDDNLVDPIISSVPSGATLLPFVLQQWNRDFLAELITSVYNDAGGIEGDFRVIFEPLLESLWREMFSNSSFTTDRKYRRPLQSLNELCDITVNVSKRPICQLMVTLRNWCVDPVTANAAGREIASLSFLSPFFRLSVFAEDDPKIVDKYYSGKQGIDSTKTTNQMLQGYLTSAREEMFPILHNTILNVTSREAALDLIGEILKRNEKRSQMQVNEKLVAPDGFMLNLCYVLQRLSLKIKREKVDLFYPFHPKGRVMVRKNDTRIKMTSSEAEEWLSTLSDSDFRDIKFHTECFFLTLESHHISLLPIIRKYQRRTRAIREYNRMADELAGQERILEAMPELLDRNRNLVRQWREQAKRLSKAKICADAGLLDPHFLSGCLRFYCLEMAILLRSVGANIYEEYQINLPVPASPSSIWSAYPEWYLEDLADFLLFTIQHVPSVIDNDPSQELIVFLVTFIANPHYASNPYLVAKLIEVIFVSSPTLHNYTAVFHHRLLSHPLSEKHLARALMKFYTDVESTGASSEFYDKFTIRYHISVIFKSMWTHIVHQDAIVSESKSTTSGLFVRFINMLMNDTTFLLDESLESLKRIHEIQEAMDRKEEWERQSHEQRQSRERQLTSDERQCRSYLTLASETVDMLEYLTASIVEPFLKPELVDRLAAMLNFNLQQLCGPKCSELKVKNAIQYGWKPKEMLKKLSLIYLHLDSETFAKVSLPYL